MNHLTRLLMIGTAVLAISDPALAKKRDHDDYYRDHYYENRGGMSRPDHRGPHDRRHHADHHRDARYYRADRVVYTRPYHWREVTVYEAPYRDYAPAAYTEIRCTNSTNPFGMLIGGIAGGALGSTIGSGSGRTVAIATGAIAGGVLGNALVQERCTEQVFREVPLGRPVSWQSAQDTYTFVPTREFNNAGRYCREYQGYATVGGVQRQTYGTACMAPDGSWEIID